MKGLGTRNAHVKYENLIYTGSEVMTKVKFFCAHAHRRQYLGMIIALRTFFPASSILLGSSSHHEKSVPCLIKYIQQFARLSSCSQGHFHILQYTLTQEWNHNVDIGQWTLPFHRPDLLRNGLSSFQIPYKGISTKIWTALKIFYAKSFINVHKYVQHLILCRNHRR